MSPFAAACTPIRAFDRRLPDGRQLTIDLVTAPEDEHRLGYWRGHRLRAELDGRLLRGGFHTPIFPPPVTPPFDDASEVYRCRYTSLRAHTVPVAARDGTPVLAAVPPSQSRTIDYLLLPVEDPVGRIDIHGVYIREDSVERRVRMATLRVCLTGQDAARFDQARARWEKRPGELARSAAPDAAVHIWRALTWRPPPGMLIGSGTDFYVVLDIVVTRRIGEDGRSFHLDTEEGYLYDVRVRELSAAERDDVGP
ncbi:hypothetical protein [Nocardia suismassiliense]|uniref:hypothetical protein n=1 Tax=Nocardia suismassiliense TaxID=2077092 RepID=UPI000D1F9EBF|nr:hypothetical protein [Nocardia suismassiliense]